MTTEKIESTHEYRSMKGDYIFVSHRDGRIVRLSRHHASQMTRERLVARYGLPALREVHPNADR